MKKNFFWLISWIFIYLTLGIVFIVNYTDNQQMKQNYMVLLITYFFVAGILLLLYLNTNMDIFEPIVFVTFLYLMIFCIAPMCNIINGDILFFGVDVMQGTIKATFIFVISYISFLIAYYLKKDNVVEFKEITYVKFSNERKREMFKIALMLWIICYLFTLIYMVSTGKNIFYILTLGIKGEVFKDEMSATPLGFISMFSYSLIPTWMDIYAYGESKLLKIITFALTISGFILRGFRFIIIIYMLAPIIFYYIKKKKYPSMKVIISLSIVIIILIGAIGFSRGGLRSGIEIEWSKFGGEAISYAIKGNFDIYQPFYGMVEVIPQYRQYSYGKEMFIYTLVMFIPRIIWPSKPGPLLHEILSLSVNKSAADSGSAFPNIGEFYFEFGVIGCIIFMFLFGFLCRKAKKLYRSKNINDNKIIAYSIILPTLMQIIIRGYIPSNFYLCIFLLMPILIISKLSFIKS